MEKMVGKMVNGGENEVGENEVGPSYIIDINTIKFFYGLFKALFGCF